MVINVENVLQNINRKYVSLDDSAVTENKRLLQKILDRMVSLLKENDLFKALFERIFYGGSVFDALKIESPNEFDIDFLLVLPKKCETHNSAVCGCLEVIPNNKPGFFWFKVKNTFYSPLNKFIRDDYVQTDLVLNWLKGLVDKALNKLEKIYIDDYDLTMVTFWSQSGPALILKTVSNFGVFYVDLVPAFKFGSKYWPKQGFKPNSTSREDFWILPKKANLPTGERYWRASFQEQERQLITGKEKLKPALRLLKKMRNNLGHKSICSYTLKTIVLWNLETWDRTSTLTEVFLGLLNKYRDHLNSKEVRYFWNKKHNLLGEIKEETLENHGNEISKKYIFFLKNMDSHPLEIAKIILKEGSEEYQRFMAEYGNEGEFHRPESVAQLQELPILRVDSDERQSGMTQEAQTSIGNAVELNVPALVIGTAVVVGLTLWRALRSRNNNR